MDGVDKLATNQAGDVDLVEVRSVGQSELLSACEVLGGRALRISREKECDLLTSEGCARAAELLRDNCPTAGWFRVPCGLWCSWTWRDSNGTDRTPQKLYKGRRLVREALKLVKQLVDTSCLFVLECPRGCLAQNLELALQQPHQTRLDEKHD